MQAAEQCHSPLLPYHPVCRPTSPSEGGAPQALPPNNRKSYQVSFTRGLIQEEATKKLAQMEEKLRCRLGGLQVG